MRIAFKEWSVIVDALGRGNQIVILRKGGIHEKAGSFTPDHNRFLLFPTRFHQQLEGVVEPARPQAASLLAHADNEQQIQFEFFAESIRCLWIDSLDAAHRLNSLHIWTEEIVRERFERGEFPGLFAMVLKVFKLPQPAMLPSLPRYGGCRSWIELDQDISIDQAKPVLPDSAFQRQLNDLENRLEPSIVRP